MPNHQCRRCYDELATWITIKIHKPFHVEFKTNKDWADEVEQELFVNKRVKKSFDSYQTVSQQIHPNSQIERCCECEKYVDKYYTGTYFKMNGEKAITCDICIREKQLNLPACSQCGERNKPREMFITGSY